MKIIYRYVLLCFIIISIAAGCTSVPSPVKDEPVQSQEVAVPAPEPVKEPEPVIKQEPVEPAVPVEPAKPESSAKAEESPVEPAPVVKKQEPVVEVKPEPAEEKNTIIAEFEGVTITKETYDQTKTEMEKIVEKLNRITATKDYTQWRTFLSEEYKEQYSQPLTLKKVSEALPVKGIKLKSLRDYFTYVFVPSRQNVRVDDIKFVSPTRVDVIMQQGNTSLLVYGLENIDGSWKLIPSKL